MTSNERVCSDCDMDECDKRGVLVVCHKAAPNGELYHYTMTCNNESIKSHGLIPGKGESSFSPATTDPETVWMDGFYYSPPSRGHSIWAVNISKLDPSKLTPVKWDTEWYRYKGVIPPEALELVEVG